MGFMNIAEFLLSGMKKDLILAAIVGFLCAVLILPIAGNLKVQIPYSQYLIIILPLLSVLGMWVAYFIAKKIAVIYQVAKFVLIGALNTLVDWGILNLLMFLTSVTAGAGYSAFKGVSFLVAATNSYFWNKFWTFKKAGQPSRQTESTGREVLQFFIVSGIGFLMNVGVATLIVNVLGPQFGFSAALWANVGALCGTLVGLTWNFLGFKLIVFKS